MPSFNIFLFPILGLLVAFVVDKLFPRAQFRGTAVLPFFLILSCQWLTQEKKWPSFLPYGFLFFFILVVIVSISISVKKKNLPLGETLLQLWDYLTISTIFWFLGLVTLVIL